MSCPHCGFNCGCALAEIVLEKDEHIQQLESELERDVMREVVLTQYRYRESNKYTTNYGRYSDWVDCSSKKEKEIRDYIEGGSSYEIRELGLISATKLAPLEG